MERKRDEREENISLGAASLLPGNRASLITVIPPNAAAAPSLPALAPAARPRRQCPPPIICFADRRAPFSTRPPLLHISQRTAPHAIRCSAQLPCSPLGRLRDAPSPTRSLTMISPHPSPSTRPAPCGAACHATTSARPRPARLQRIVPPHRPTRSADTENKKEKAGQLVALTTACQPTSTHATATAQRTTHARTPPMSQSPHFCAHPASSSAIHQNPACPSLSGPHVRRGPTSGARLWPGPSPITI